MRVDSERASVGVHVEDVVKRFDGRTVLDRVSLNVEPGEFFTLLGPSGCGKTTLLRAIAGYHPIEEGRVLIGAEDVTRLPPWERKVGFVFQNYALWPDKTVFENVAYGLRVRKRPEVEIRERVARALGLVRLSGVEAKAPGALSGGMQQRAALARALVVDPPVLLFDEPLSNLDAALRVHLRRDIRAIQRDLGTTAIYVTHDQEEALEISDRIAVMHEGRLAQVADPETIYERPADATVARFVGTANLFQGRRAGDAFALDGGGSVDLDQIVNGRDLPEGGAATMLARPEWLAFRPGGPIVGRVVARFYQGGASRYALETRSGATVLHDSAERFEPGETLALAPARAWLLPDTIARAAAEPRAALAPA